MYGHSSKNCFQRARCVKCLGDHGTAACTRNKDTDGPPACVLCKSSGHTANYLGCPRAPKRITPLKIKSPPLSRAASSAARAVTHKLSYASDGRPPYGPATPNKTNLTLREH
ncbi:hypothetical protein EVAR_76955_1 [Eumeta japonica]|uniref:Nucleic-acid-binding protein from transposon X-element n=1 Tax=Eumeta variegata TaxID=151549 RepID=A0A4C1SEW1_EUMVA|nr:hypothetical protein EVAR_76955_1 [Eumeta japonica]